MKHKKKAKSKSKEPSSKTMLVNFILDETGSMGMCKAATISGFNEYVQTLKERKGKVFFTLTKFNSAKTEVVHAAVNIDKVRNLDEQSYIPTEMTPLYDAIAKTIFAAQERVEGKKMNVLCVIMSDGEENASKEYTRVKLFDLIKLKERDGWTFVYLGANQDSYKVGQAIGINLSNVANYDQNKTTKAFACVARATMNYADNAVVGCASVGFFAGAKPEDMGDDSKAPAGSLSNHSNMKMKDGRLDITYK